MELADETETTRVAGRPAAFEQIFRRETFRTVERWLDRLGVPSSDRGDLVQDVLLAALTSFHGYDPMRGRPERWLNRITVHVAAHYRDRARHWREEPLLDDFEMDSGVPAPDDQLEAARDRKLVLDVLGAIEDEPCAIVVAHDIEGVPMAELAERHKVPLSTAYKRRARGMAAFQAAVHRALGDCASAGDEVTMVASRPDGAAARGGPFSM